MHAASRRAEGKRSSATGEVRPDAFLLCVFVLLLFWCSPAFPAPFEGLTVLKISPRDERAVVRAADGKVLVVKPGDAIAGGTVIEIAEGRVVLEERKGSDKETVIIRLKDGKQTVERIRKTPPSEPQQQMKVVSSQPSATGKSGKKSSIN
jgi:hypothetical protein